MADEQTAAQGDTTAAVESDNASTETQTQGIATPDGVQQDAATTQTEAAPDKGEGLLAGNKEEAATAPESYEAFKVDEALGFGDEEQEWLQSQAKESGLPQEQAQKAVDMFVNGLKEYKSVTEEAQKEAFEKFRDENKAEWEKHPEHAELTLRAEKAVSKLGIKDYLVETGYVHDAKLLGVLAELGRFYSESTADSGGEVGGNGEKSVAQILFPNL